MRIALINPGSPRALRKENLGLAYLSACLDADGHATRIVDEVAGQDVDEALDAFKPDLVGITCMTMQAGRAYELADAVRGKRGVRVVLGGAHPSALPEEAAQHADCVVRGEAELTFPRLVREGNVEGVVEGEPAPELDALPMPNREQLDLEFYASGGDQLTGHSCRTLGIITSRGCPYRCTFCVNSKRETCLRFHRVERVLEEIRYLVERHRIQGVAFYDELIASDPVRFRGLCEAMIAGGLDRLKWECQMHPRSVRPDLLEVMKRAGCFQVAIGFESGSQRVLDAIEKNTLVEQNLEAACRVVEAGLRLRGCFVIGVPGETAEDVRLTEEFIERAPIDFASVHYLTPMPGSALFDQFADEIASSGVPWDTFTAGDPGTFQCNSTMTPEEQTRLFLKLSARLAFRNYSWGEKIRRALRQPRRALHVVLQRLI